MNINERDEARAEGVEQARLHAKFDIAAEEWSAVVRIAECSGDRRQITVSAGAVLHAYAQIEAATRERDEARAIANDRDAMVDHRDRALTAMHQRVDVITQERDKARALNVKWAEKAATWSASPEAAQRLQGYRDLAQQVAQAQNERDKARTEVKKLRKTLDEIATYWNESHRPAETLDAAEWTQGVAEEALAATKAKPVNPDGLPTYDKENALFDYCKARRERESAIQDRVECDLRATIEMHVEEAVARETERLRGVLLTLANAADDVGVQFFDMEDPPISVAQMRSATLAARAALAALQEAKP